MEIQKKSKYQEKMTRKFKTQRKSLKVFKNNLLDKLDRNLNLKLHHQQESIQQLLKCMFIYKVTMEKKIREINIFKYTELK